MESTIKTFHLAFDYNEFPEYYSIRISPSMMPYFTEALAKGCEQLGVGVEFAVYDPETMQHQPLPPELGGKQED